MALKTLLRHLALPEELCAVMKHRWRPWLRDLVQLATKRKRSSGQRMHLGFESLEDRTLLSLSIQSLTCYAPSATVTNATNVAFQATFNENVTGVDPTDFQLVRTGTVGATLTQVTPVSASVYTITISGITGNGTLGLNLINTGNIKDSSGAGLSINNYPSPLYTIDTVAPFVESINRTTPPGPLANATTVIYTVTFSEPVTGVNSSDFVLAPTGTAAGTVTQVTPVSAAVYTVTVSGVTGSGQLGLNLVDNNSIRDEAGNNLAQATLPLSFQSQTYATGPRPSSVVAADLNGDGFADLIVANYFGSSVSVLLGNGNGTFQNQRAFAAGIYPNSVAVADVNGDGKPDLIVANGYTDGQSATVSVLLGNGNGTFQSPIPSATATDPKSVVVADVNGDGKSDLIVACNTGVSVLLSNGNGTFQSPINYAAVRYGAADIVNSVAVADVNGDGKPDIVVGSNLVFYGLTTVSVLLGNGNGTFQSPSTFAGAGSPVAVADVNGDGNPDLIVGNYAGNSLGILLGNGNGTFQSLTTFGTAGVGFGARPVYSVAVADVNGDGKPDLIVGNTNGNQSAVGVFLGNGNGTFQNLINVATDNFGVVSLAVANVSGGSRPDLVFTNSNTNTVSVLIGNGDFTGQAYNFDAPYVQSITLTSPAGPNTAATSVSYTVAYNEAVTGVDPNDFMLLLTGTAAVTQQIQVAPVSGSVYTVTVSGITGKGTLSLKLVDNGNIRSLDGSALVQPNAPLSFQLASTFPAGAAPAFTAYSVAVADVNGDGKPDLVTSGYYFSSSSSSVNVLPGNGNGSFQAPLPNYSGPFPKSVTIADIDGDGKPDLVYVYGYRNSYGVNVLLGNGNGTFKPASPLLLRGTGYLATAFADVNGDGKSDLVEVNRNGSGSVLLGNGNGTFQTAIPFVAVPYATSVAVGDVNGDGNVDLVVASSTGNTAAVLLGNGNGSFQTSIPISNGFGKPYSLALADLNGDGNSDLVVANGNDVEAMVGNGNGTFQPPTILPYSAYSVAVGDLTGDGKMDLVIASKTGNVSVLLNSGNGDFTRPVSTVDVDPAAITSGTGSSQSTIVGSGFPTTLSATVTNDLDQPIQGANVTFTAPASGAGGVFPSGLSATVVTGPDGIATAPVFTANDVTGSYTVDASSGGVGTSFNLTNSLVNTPNLQSTITQVITVASGGGSGGPPATVTIAVSTSADAQTVVAAVNGLAPQSTPVDVQVDISSGSLNDVVADPPANVTLIITGNGMTTTIVGQSPALTVTSGNVVVTGMTLTTATDAPTILVSGGSLMLRDDTIEESTGYNDAAIDITGGTVDMGTSNADPGGNTLDVNGLGQFVVNQTGSSVPAVGNTYEVNGVDLSATELSYTALSSSPVAPAYGQAVTLTATVEANDPSAGTPTGTVDFQDTSTGTDLGTATLENGVAAVTVSTLALGSHTITAYYQGDPQFTLSADSGTVAINRLVPSTFVVTDTLDAYQQNIGTDNPTDTNNLVSLRSAIAAANFDAVNGVSDTIDFAPNLNGATLTETQGALELTSGSGTTTIDGGGQITVSGNNTTHVFYVDGGAQAVLTGLAIENGNAFNANEFGGGISNGGTLTVSNTTFSNNSATFGGGIANQGGTLTVSDCTFSTNFSHFGGGGIFNEGSTPAGPFNLTVINSTFSDNSGDAIQTDGGAVSVSNAIFVGNTAGSGGAIGNIDGTIVVSNASFTDNSAQALGGAIYSDITNSLPTTMTVTNATFTGNSATLAGGAIETVGVWSLSNVTLSGNSSANGGGIAVGNGTLSVSNATISGNSAATGGGIDIRGSLQLVNTIVSGNTASSAGPDIYGPINVDNGYNLLGTAVNNNTNDPNPGPSDVFSDTPLLAPLGNYGGPTQTMALLPGSPAIGSGGAVTTLTTALTAGNGSITVANGAAFASASPPSGSGYVIEVDSEEMLVTAVSGNTLTVTRGYNGTAPAPHSSGAAVFFATDRRGVSHPPSSPDIGAFQSRGFTLTVNAGDSPQSTEIGTAFANPLGVTVASAYGDPVAGGLITYTAPNSGPGASLSSLAATINATGQASITATANDAAGTFILSANVAGGLTTDFQLINQANTCTTLTASPTSALIGQPVTLTATVQSPASNTPSGTVEFYDTSNGLCLGSAPLTGSTAILTTSALPIGNQDISAEYEGTYYGQYPNGAFEFFNSTSETITESVNPLTTANLQTSIAQQSAPAQGGPPTVTVQVSTPADAQTVVAAVNGLAPQSTPVDVQVDISSGSLNDVVADPPANVTLIITGNGMTTTIVGQSPALTVTGGNVVVTGMTLTTATDAPTILVTGGSLMLRDDTIEESTGFDDAAIDITGGTVDMGTSGTDPGGNALDVNGQGQFVVNQTGSTVPAVGNTYEVNGVALSATELSYTALSSSPVAPVYGQAVTLTAMVQANDPSAGTPTGMVDFQDTSTNTDLGTAALQNGVAAVNTSDLGLGSHTIAAFYQSDPQFTLSADSSTIAINQAKPTVTVSGGPFAYDGNPQGAAATAIGLGGANVSGTFTFTYNGSCTLPTNVGTYTVAATFTSSDPNYADTTAIGSIIINPAPLTITANSTSKTYGQTATLAGTAFTTCGLLNNDAVTSVTLTSAGTAATATVAGSPYSIVPSAAVGTGLGNYTIAYADGQLTVNPASTTTSISAPAITYSAQGMATVTVTSAAGTPTGNVALSVDGGTAATEALASGSYTFDVGMLGSGTHSLSASYAAQGNFAASSATGTLTVSMGNSIVVLNATAAGALTLSGNAGINLAGVVDVDSNSASALSASGNATVAAGSIQVVGHVQKSGNASLSPAPVTGAAVVADPLASLPALTSSGMVARGAVNLSGNSSLTISPGIYSSIAVSGNAQLTLTTGIYAIAGGGLSVTGNASISGACVLIYNAGSNFLTSGGSGGTFGSVTLSGNGSISLTPMTTGTYTGILIFQSRDNTKAMTLSGNALAMPGGVIYAAAASLTMSGNGQMKGSLIVNTMTISGNSIAQLSASEEASGYTPAQIRSAYGINDLSLDGTGQTIALVEAYDNPDIYQAVDTFDQQFGLTATGSNLYQQYGPASSFVTVLNQNGQATPLPATDPSGGWEEEEALDVEWTHAMAPGAQIVVVESNSQALADLMAGVVVAANQPNVSVVSMSWGFAEGQAVFQQDEALYDSAFTTPAGHQPVTFLASTGDYGTADPEYPAFSPNVVAVGGTSLFVNSDNSYNGETGWGYYSSSVGTLIGSGGGTSLYEPEPAYQQGVQSSGSRSTPDVAFVADPNTGTWIADPYNLSPSNPWEVAGGTSLSTPCWAGLIAVADQGRAGASESTLSSSSGVTAQQALYTVPKSDFNSITSGSNGGYTAAAGYNMVTGLGTPVANLLVPGLIGYQSISPANLTAANQPSIPAAPGSSSGFDGSTTNVFNVFNVETTAGQYIGHLIGLHAAALQGAGEADSADAGTLTGGNVSYFTEPATALHPAGIDAVMAEMIRTDTQGDEQTQSNPRFDDLPSMGGIAGVVGLDSSVVFQDAEAVDHLLDGTETDWFLLSTAPKISKA